MKIETDYEILHNLLNQLIKIDNDNDRKTILTDLEFYLHQVKKSKINYKKKHKNLF